MAYRISEWDKHFENSRTRGYRHLDWVPVPNKMDGDGYTDLVDHSNAAAHLGAWIAIVEIASRQEQDKRGTIPEGRRGTAKTLAAISRLPVSIFEEVLPRLCEIGWLEEYDATASAETPQNNAADGKTKGEDTQPDAGVIANSAEIPQGAEEILQDAAVEQKRTEENRTEQNQTEENGTEQCSAPLEVVIPSMPAEVGQERWEDFRLAAMAAGLDIGDEMVCRKRWARMNIPEKMAAVVGINQRLQAGMYDDPRYTPSAESYLVKSKWLDRIRPCRTDPQREKEQRDRRDLETAARMYKNFRLKGG